MKPPYSISLGSQSALFLALLATSISTASAAPIEWNNTKTGTLPWGTAANWIGGTTPTATDDVKVSGIATSSTLTNVTSFRNLDLQSGGATIVLLTATNSDFSATSIHIKGVDGLANLSTSDRTTAFNVSGAILVEGDGANIGRFSASKRTVVTAGSLTFGGNGTGTRAANLNFVGPESGQTLKFDIPTVTFNNGSSFTDSAAWTGGTIEFTGDVLLQEGNYTGRAASFQLGRAASSGTVRIGKNLTVNSGEVLLRSAIDLQVGEDISIGSGAQISFGTETLSVLNKFSAGGSLTLKTGGTLNLSADLGGLILEVGKDLVVENASTLILATGAQGTQVELGGNLKIEAQALQGGSNFNTMRLSLAGDGTQTLEAAVTDSNATFAVDLLKLNGSTVRLEDNVLNIASGEYFRTNQLQNVGNSTIDLNGMRFFVGTLPESGVFLTPGVYTEFGGTLTVIPEPSTACLLTLTAAGLAITGRSMRRRF